jgi:hypothetical protein
MAITATDIEFRLSGGAANSDPTLSLGGAQSSTAVTSGTFFSTITGAQASAGRTRYRGMYLRNSHATLAYQSAGIWVGTDTPSADTDADVALAAEAVNVTMATIATETTAPTSVTFTNAAVSLATMLAIGDIPATQFKGIWVKNVINAAAAPVNDSFTMNVTGDSAP